MLEVPLTLTVRPINRPLRNGRQMQARSAASSKAMSKTCAAIHSPRCPEPSGGRDFGNGGIYLVSLAEQVSDCDDFRLSEDPGRRANASFSAAMRLLAPRRADECLATGVIGAYDWSPLPGRDIVVPAASSHLAPTRQVALPPAAWAADPVAGQWFDATSNSAARGFG